MHLKLLILKIMQDLQHIYLWSQFNCHIHSRSVVREILLKILQGMLMAYEKLLTVRKKGSKSELPLSQQAALQTLFNVKYIMSMIPWRDDSEVKEGHSCDRYVVSSSPFPALHYLFKSYLFCAYMRTIEPI